MATKFLEPGGDADFLSGTNFWASGSNGGVATDFVNGAHIKSTKYRPNTADACTTGTVMADAGSRLSFYVYLVALPTATASLLIVRKSLGATVIQIRITTAGALQLWNASAQIGSNGSTLSTGTWYRISLAYTITSTSVNELRLFKDGVSDISVTNATFAAIGTLNIQIGINVGGSTDATLDFRSSDHYIDDSSALTDPGNVWVTAKRPNANGTTNGFTTQIGSGGSGYGSGHSPQVNERALSTTNGWSMVGAGSAVTEEYNIESSSTGDIDISAATIVDYCGWISQSALVSETATIITGGVNSTYATGTTTKVITQFAGSSTYPAGTGADIGVTTSTDLTTFNLFEAGIIVAYIPGGGGTFGAGTRSGGLLTLGVG